MSTTEPPTIATPITIRSKISLKHLVTSVILTVIIFALGCFAFWITLYPAAIGYGGETVPFYTALSLVVVIPLLSLIAYNAVDGKETWHRVTALLLLLLIVVLVTTSKVPNSWDWSQFGYGVAVLGLVATAAGFTYFHKTKLT